jgi:bifunctional DNA-binding transcriptional regulator/antitoxin component of YhaV-PrlF toxin-antitoxin module
MSKEGGLIALPSFFVYLTSRYESPILELGLKMCKRRKKVAEVKTLHDGMLQLPKTWLESVGLKENDPVIVDYQETQLIVKPLSEAETARKRLILHLGLPVGSLKDQSLNPDEPITIHDEIGKGLYEDID